MLTHRVDGTGPPLLLLNGGLMSIPTWQPFIAPFLERFTVIRCDFRGQLLSPGAGGSIDDHAADVVSLIDHLRLDAVHLAGISFGGGVALAFASTFPERVETLTVISATERTTPAMRADARELAGVARAAAAGGDGGELVRRISATTWTDAFLATQPADFVEARARQVANLPPAFFEGTATIVEALLDVDLTARLSAITARTLVVCGDGDRVFPVEHSRTIAALIPGARLLIVPGTGHGALFERAEFVIGEILQFIDAAATARPHNV